MANSSLLHQHSRQGATIIAMQTAPAVMLLPQQRTNKMMRVMMTTMMMRVVMMMVKIQKIMFKVLEEDAFRNKNWNFALHTVGPFASWTPLAIDT